MAQQVSHLDEHYKLMIWTDTHKKNSTRPQHNLRKCTQSPDDVNVTRFIKLQASPKFLDIFKAPLHIINISVYFVQPSANRLVKMPCVLPLNYEHQFGGEATKEVLE